ACGFLVDEKAGKARPQAINEVKALSLPVLQPESAFETIQRIEAREVPRLADLMETTVEEIDAYHDAVALREKRIRALEDELTGHVKGGFSGGSRGKPGLFKVADGGTFFLDEVADMSAAMQVKLLRVLQEGTFVPVGGTRPEKVDVRIIAASNKDLREMVVRREVREDLFYRLHVVVLEVPGLRGRVDDLAVPVEHFLEAVA